MYAMGQLSKPCFLSEHRVGVKIAVPMFPLYSQKKAAITSGPCFYQMVSFQIQMTTLPRLTLVDLVQFHVLHLRHQFRGL